MSQTILVGHVLDRLKKLEDKSIHACVTSPPYYLLRRYESEHTTWGGSNECEHKWEERFISNPNSGGGPSEKQDSNAGSRSSDKGKRRGFKTHLCSSCGAWKGELGHEPLGDCLRWARGEPPCSYCFVCHMRTIFAEVYRVLRDDGCLFLNLDDSMSGTGAGKKQTGKASYRTEHWPNDKPIVIPGLKRGDKCCVPERVALALQADGWILRSSIVWAKINPICESTPSYGWFWEPHRIKVQEQEKGKEGKQKSEGKAGLNERYHEDKGTAKWILCPGCDDCSPNDGLILRKFSGRPTEAYEYIFLLVKKMSYFWDTINAKVPYSPATLPQVGVNYRGKSRKKYVDHGANDASETKRRVVDSLSANGGRNLWNYYVGTNSLADFWMVESEPSGELHYATFGTRIPNDCIKVATSDKGVCPKCKTPWSRVVQRLREHGQVENLPHLKIEIDSNGEEPDNLDKLHRRTNRAREEGEPHGQSLGGMKAVGWKASCKCNAGDPIPATVIDPFVGSGTTLYVAEALGREGIGIERKPEYAEIARTRVSKGKGQVFTYYDSRDEPKEEKKPSFARQSIFGDE